MGYEDFVYFMLSEEDKSSEPSLEYWYVLPFLLVFLPSFCKVVLASLGYGYVIPLSFAFCLGTSPDALMHYSRNFYL